MEQKIKNQIQKIKSLGFEVKRFDDFAFSIIKRTATGEALLINTIKSEDLNKFIELQELDHKSGGKQ